MSRSLLITAILLTASLNVVAQTITDSTTIKLHSPRKAAHYSAVLPGFGQVYNRKYWKVPIVYGAGAVAGYMIYYNATITNKLNTALRYRKDDDPETSLDNFTLQRFGGKQNIDLTLFGDDEIATLKDTYRRDLDLSVLFAVAVYGLNILDAVVDAHLFSFDVSEDLTMQIKPAPITASTGIHPGLSIKFSSR